MNTQWNDWDIAGQELGLELITPFEICISGGHKIHAEFLVKSFGARNGMLIITSYDVVQPYVKELNDLGYGFCVLERLEEGQTYDREEFVDMLNDWGWMGDPTRKPSWILD